MTQFRPTLDVRDEVENVKFKLRSACNHLKKQYLSTETHENYYQVTDQCLMKEK